MSKLQEIAREAVIADHFAENLKWASEAAHYQENLANVRASHVLKTKSIDEIAAVLDERIPFECQDRCKECGRFVERGMPCVRCPKRHAAIQKALVSVFRERSTMSFPEQEEILRRLSEVIEESRKLGPGGKGRGWRNIVVDLGAVPSEAVETIRRIAPDINVTDESRMTIDTKQVVHALKEHGEKGAKLDSEVPLTESDIRLVPDILVNNDGITNGLGKSEGKKQNGLEFWKKVDAHTFLCVMVERVADQGVSSLKFQTMLKFRLPHFTQRQ